MLFGSAWNQRDKKYIHVPESSAAKRITNLDKQRPRLFEMEPFNLLWPESSLRKPNGSPQGEHILCCPLEKWPRTAEQKGPETGLRRTRSWGLPSGAAGVCTAVVLPSPTAVCGVHGGKTGRACPQRCPDRQPSREAVRRGPSPLGKRCVFPTWQGSKLHICDWRKGLDQRISLLFMTICGLSWGGGVGRGEWGSFFPSPAMLGFGQRIASG